jgi:Dolichyl-phosphate-mannose-protein mannosyltransferase
VSGAREPRLGARDFAALSALLALAAALRLCAWQRTAVMFNDGPIFLALAEALRAGRIAEVLAHPQHPLYPALIAVFGGWSGSDEAAAVWISVAGGVAAVAAVFAMARARFGRAVAWPAAWVVALHPWAIDFSADVMSDGLYAGLYLTGFALLVSLLERPSIGFGLAFGLVAGLAFLARPEALVLVAGAALLFAWQAVTEAEAARRRARLLAAACALLVCAAIAGGYRLGAAVGGAGVELTSKKSVAELARGGPSEPARALERAKRREANRRPDALPLPEGSLRVDTPRAPQPERSLAGGLEAVARVLATSVSAFRHELALFALVGLVVSGRWARGGRARSQPLPAYERVAFATLSLHTGVLVLLVWGAGYVSRRHALAVWLPLLPFCVLGFEALWARLVGHRAPARASLFVLIALLVVSFGPRDLRERRMDRALERGAAEWLRERGPAAGPVAAQKRRTAYYAGRPFVPLPDGRNGLIERQLRARGTRFVIIDAAKLDDHAGLAAGIGDWLEPVHTARAAGQAVLVLELTAGPAG